MKKALFLLIVIASIASPSLAQKQGKSRIDSLLSVLKTAKPDTAKVNTLNNLAYEFRNNNPDTTIYFAGEARALAIKMNYKLGIADAYLYSAMALYILLKYEKALKNSNDALTIYDQLLPLAAGTEKTGDKSKILKQKAKAINVIGSIYTDQNNCPEAMKNYSASLKIREEIGDNKGIAASYNNIGRIYAKQGIYPEALKNYFASLKISKEIGNKEGISLSYQSIGGIYEAQGNYPEALKNYFASLKISKEIGNKKGISLSYQSIGGIYDDQGNYPEALKNYFASLKISEEIGNKQEIADNYNEIGYIYANQDNYPEALKNYFASLKISEEIGNKRGIALAYNDIGLIYKDQGNYPEALKNHFASLKISEEIGYKWGILASYNNIGIVYHAQGNYPEALKNYFASLKISKEIGNKKDIANTCNNIGMVYTRQKKNNEASQYLNKGLSLAKEIGNLDIIMNGYYGLAALDSAQGNCTKSLEHYKMYIATRDSMFNMEKTKKIMQIEVDKKEALAKAEQEHKDALALKELQKQKLVRNGFIGGFAIVLIFAGVFLRQRNKISKGKKIIEAEKKRSEELLLNILPYEVAEELKQTGHCQAKTFSMVTVMFMDFKDFTSVSEKVSAELLVDEINSCFSAFDGIIQKYKVEKIKTVGDAYICAGGLPVLNQTHARDIVHAAIEIQGFMLARKKEKEDKDEFAFEMRIGIHTGPVVAGIVGVKKFQYDIWGDTVNLAARMEQNSEAGKINISGSTYKLVKDKFTCTYRGKIEAKNKGEVEMYFVTNPDTPVS